MALRHTFQCTLPDGTNTLKIQPQRDWNNDSAHEFAGGTNGDLLCVNNAVTGKLTTVPAGAGSGTFLISNGSGSAPSYTSQLSWVESSKKLTIGPNPSAIAGIRYAATITDPTAQFGLDISPVFGFVGSSTEATAIHAVTTLANGVAKGATAGLVIEEPVMGAGASFTEYYSGIFRGSHGISGITFAVSLSVETSADRTLWVGTNENGTTWQKGIVFGASSDTNLYRVGANQLKTDDQMIIALTCQVGADFATPAGGSANVRLVFGTTVGFGIYIGSGAPTVSAAKGSLYLRSDGSANNNRAFINTDGGTTWTAISTVA